MTEQKNALAQLFAACGRNKARRRILATLSAPILLSLPVACAPHTHDHTHDHDHDHSHQHDGAEGASCCLDDVGSISPGAVRSGVGTTAGQSLDGDNAGAQERGEGGCCRRLQFDEP